MDSGLQPITEYPDNGIDSARIEYLLPEVLNDRKN